MSNSSPMIKEKQAMERMRSGSCLIHMHGTRNIGPHWFVVPGGPVSDVVAKRIREHPCVTGGKDGLFPHHDQTWRFV
jgi:hypothetical protein